MPENALKGGELPRGNERDLLRDGRGVGDVHLHEERGVAEPAAHLPPEVFGPDLEAMAAALGQAGFYDPDSLAAALANELSEHARLVELADRERTELEAAGPPIYELPLIAEGIDLAALHKLAAELRDQGAA